MYAISTLNASSMLPGNSHTARALRATAAMELRASIRMDAQVVRVSLEPVVPTFLRQTQDSRVAPARPDTVATVRYATTSMTAQSHHVGLAVRASTLVPTLTRACVILDSRGSTVSLVWRKIGCVGVAR